MHCGGDTRVRLSVSSGAAVPDGLPVNYPDNDVQDEGIVPGASDGSVPGTAGGSTLSSEFLRDPDKLI